MGDLSSLGTPRELTFCSGEEGRIAPPHKKRRVLSARASASYDNDEYREEELDAQMVLHLPSVPVNEHSTASNTPQSTSPRSELTSHEEANKEHKNDLDMLVVAALESDVKAEPQQHLEYAQSQSMHQMPFGFAPFMPDAPQFFYAFWMFERQPMVPVCLPVMSVGRDVVLALRTQLMLAGLVPADARVQVFVRLASQQVFSVDENSPHHVAALGLLNPTTLLEVTCQHA